MLGLIKSFELNLAVASIEVMLGGYLEASSGLQLMNLFCCLILRTLETC